MIILPVVIKHLIDLTHVGLLWASSNAPSGPVIILSLLPLPHTLVFIRPELEIV